MPTAEKTVSLSGFLRRAVGVGLALVSLVPVFAVAYGAVFLHEAITPWMLLCAAIIVCGVALSTGIVRLGRGR